VNDPVSQRWETDLVTRDGARPSGRSLSGDTAQHCGNVEKLPAAAPATIDTVRILVTASDSVGKRQASSGRT
jgi:hypothetical protein